MVQKGIKRHEQIHERRRKSVSLPFSEIIIPLPTHSVYVLEIVACNVYSSSRTWSVSYNFRSMVLISSGTTTSRTDCVLKLAYSTGYYCYSYQIVVSSSMTAILVLDVNYGKEVKHFTKTKGTFCHRGKVYLPVQYAVCCKQCIFLKFDWLLRLIIINHYSLSYCRFLLYLFFAINSQSITHSLSNTKET